MNRIQRLEPWSYKRLIGGFLITDGIGPGVKLPKDWISEPQGNGGTANLARKKKIKKAASLKLQAALTMDPGACRMNIEREEIWK